MTGHKHRFQVVLPEYRLWVNNKNVIQSNYPYNSNNICVKMYSFICECGETLEVRAKESKYVGVKLP